MGSGRVSSMRDCLDVAKRAPPHVRGCLLIVGVGNGQR